MRASSLVLCLLLGACGPSGDGPGEGGDGGATSGAITIAPADAVVEVLNGVRPELAYTATRTRDDGTTEDVTALVTWSVVDAGLGAFTASSFRPSGIRGGQTMVSASLDGVTATTGLTVRIVNVRVDPTAPPNAPELFGAATEDPARAPAVVYPSDGTMVPPNLGDFEVHWTASGNDLFEVALISPVLDLRAYVLPPADPTAMWLAFTPDEWALARETSRAGSLRVSVRGLSTAAPATFGASSPIAVKVALEDLEGGIYYWAASAAGVYRHDFGQPGQAAQPFYTPAEAGRCVACHALSRDGTKMAVTFDGGDGAMTVIDVATRTPFIPVDGSFRSNFTAFSPDGARMLTTFHGLIQLREPTTGAVLTDVPTAGYATHPDFSPVGDRIVYSMPAGATTDWVFSGGRIVTQAYDAASGTFGAQAEIANGGGANLYYPTFSPDGAWVLYNRSTEDAYDDGTAELYVTRADGSITPILLASPNVSTGLTNSWGRWAPFEQNSGTEPMFWFTFSSKRAFGVRMAAGTRPQVWMAPFFPSRAAAGMDPSLPAFRLPFQDLATSNHIAQWTETVVPVE